MVVSTTQWTRSTTARLGGMSAGRRPTPITGAAEWVPCRTPPRLTIAGFVRAFHDDRRLIGLKFMMLAAIVIAAAVLDWAV